MSIVAVSLYTLRKKHKVYLLSSFSSKQKALEKSSDGVAKVE
jgi:hypothetical protein